MKFVKINNVDPGIDFYQYNADTTDQDCISFDKMDEYRLYYIILTIYTDFPKGLNMYFKHNNKLYRFTQICKNELTSLKKLVKDADISVYELTKVVGI